MSAAIAFLLISPLLLATTVFSIETWLGVIQADLLTGTAPDASTIVVLMPAHDEEHGIGAVIEVMRSRLPESLHILVVADNCSDRTASIARDAGVEVIERRDPMLRGKGYALDFRRHHLSARQPACVVIIDADTVPEAGAIERLAGLAIAQDRPVQGAYTLTVGDQDGSISRFSAAAFYIKNAVRQLGASRLHTPAVLAGSGMAFPWRVFAKIPLATGHVAEDLMIGVHCAMDGDWPLFDPSAVILGATASNRGTTVQRRRWESGFLQVSSDSALPLIAQSIRTGRPRLAWLGLHLLTPPFVPLLAANCLASLILGACWLAGLDCGAATLTIAILTLTAVSAAVTALLLHGRADLLRGWHRIPGYLVWKLSLSLNALISRERRWIRTDRD